jgi:hypothetical protein
MSNFIKEAAEQLVSAGEFKSRLIIAEVIERCESQGVAIAPTLAQLKRELEILKEAQDNTYTNAAVARAQAIINQRIKEG